MVRGYGFTPLVPLCAVFYARLSDRRRKFVLESTVGHTESAADTLSMEELFPMVYNELRQIAARKLRSERSGHTLCTTALVHEAWLDLTKLNRIQWRNRPQFFAIAAQAMRRILIDYAVARRTKKRGGGLPIESLDNEGALAIAHARSHELMALDEALIRLSALNDRQARIVECRFYAGMSIEETADALDVSPATVKREWATARAWLNRELRS
jgi:RNA polymerase sigma factor (TIGR02999 family)